MNNRYNLGKQSFINKTTSALCLGLIVQLLFPLGVAAQKDTTRKTSTIDINSAYKPVLRNAVKINFSATHLNADTSTPNLTYNIPAQNLFYAYQPVPLNPLVMEQDTNLYLGTRNYIKVGYGNFSTPYINAGFSFGDGRQYLANVYADYISSKGKLLYQDYSRMHIKAAGSYFLPKNELYGGVDVKLMDNFQYGYDTSIYKYSKKDVRQQFQDLSVHVGLRNTVRGNYGIFYNPNLQISSFTNADKLSETSFVLAVPIEKKFGEAFAFKVEGRADVTNYNSKNLFPNVKFNNNIFQVAPSLVMSTPRFSLNGGIIPTWDNGKFVWLPNVYAEAFIQENVFAFQAGWVGRYIKNSFRNLSAINPWLNTLAVQQNTRETEFYGGIKATMGNHFNFNAKAGFVTYHDLALFINDTATDNKGFIISNESKANNLRIHGDLSYVNKEKFTVTAGLTLNGYTGLTNNGRAWHTVPMEFTGSMRWWAFKQVLLKADFYAFGSGHYLSKGNISNKFSGGSDLSAGIEFKVSKMFSAWMDVNNIFNNTYERWHNYQVYGLNLLGGVRVNF